MALRAMVLWLALSGLTATTTTQTVPAPEKWTPISRATQTITGGGTFTPSEIRFQNGKSLPLAPGGQMLLRPEAKKKKVIADLYRVTSPDEPVLLAPRNGMSYVTAVHGATVMSDRYLAHIVIEIRRELAIASKLDVRQVEMDIAARRREANVGKRWALQRGRIQRELAKLGTSENDWIKQALGSSLTTMRLYRQLAREWARYEIARRAAARRELIFLPE